MNVAIVVLGWISIIFSMYQTAISISGMFRKDNKTMFNPKNKFAVFVCAHHEEEVIGESVKTLHNLKYPNHLYDIIVISDNNSDSTTRVARDAGAIVWERWHDTKKSKGYALEWAFNRLWEEGYNYDAVVILDADNLVHPDFLTHINNKMIQGYDVVQGNVETKNSRDTWVTKAYAVSFWISNRMSQYAKDRIGLSAQIAGTGFAVRCTTLREIGWHASCLTEDMQWSCEYVLKTNRAIGYSHEAIVYDEKVTTFKASYTQRMRWAIGHFDVMMNYAGKLLKHSITHMSLNSFDVMMYVVQPGKIIMTAIFMIIGLLNLIYPTSGLPVYIWGMGIITYYILPIVAMLVDKKGMKVFWFLYCYIFSLSLIPITFISLTKRKQTTWAKTVHTRAMSLQEVNT